MPADHKKPIKTILVLGCLNKPLPQYPKPIILACLRSVKEIKVCIEVQGVKLRMCKVSEVANKAGWVLTKDSWLGIDKG